MNQNALVKGSRPIYEIAAEIRKEWKSVNYAAKPYLQALESLNSPQDNYGCDDGKSIALYFLSNATSFRGPKAKELKAELKAAYKIK